MAMLQEQIKEDTEKHLQHLTSGDILPEQVYLTLDERVALTQKLFPNSNLTRQKLGKEFLRLGIRKKKIKIREVTKNRNERNEQILYEHARDILMK